MRALAIFGWVLSLALVIGIAGPLFGTCTQGDDGPWVTGLIVFSPVGVIGLAVASTGAELGWRYAALAIPHVATLLLGILLIPTYFSQTTINGLHVCTVRDGTTFEAPASFAQQLWAPSWLAVLIVLAYVVFLYWSKGHVLRNG